ncbi:MAG: DUF2892 domain-containing protein [Caldilineaceae bacterium]|nr:DUF2892 domain-containing protein [Caldilineaceae bacterium]
MFSNNESGWDRILRVVLGIALIYVGWSGMVAGTLGTVLLVIGFIPLLTGVIGWCPLYSLFRIGTKSA